MKHTAPQFALDLGPAEPFKLVQEIAPDSDRIAAELDQADRDRQAAAVLQPDLPNLERCAGCGRLILPDDDCTACASEGAAIQARRDHQRENEHWTAKLARMENNPDAL